MQRNYTRQQVIEARIQIDELREALMFWIPVGLAFLQLTLHILSKITIPI